MNILSLDTHAEKLYWLKRKKKRWWIVWITLYWRYVNTKLKTTIVGSRQSQKSMEFSDAWRYMNLGLYFETMRILQQIRFISLTLCVCAIFVFPKKDHRHEPTFDKMCLKILDERIRERSHDYRLNPSFQVNHTLRKIQNL